VFEWIRRHLNSDGLPGLMMIIGEKGKTGIHLGQI
jgi:hypothetical protein